MDARVVGDFGVERDCEDVVLLNRDYIAVGLAQHLCIRTSLGDEGNHG